MHPGPRWSSRSRTDRNLPLECSLPGEEGGEIAPNECGDGICDDNEDVETCPEDAWSCLTPLPRIGRTRLLCGPGMRGDRVFRG